MNYRRSLFISDIAGCAPKDRTECQQIARFSAEAQRAHGWIRPLHGLLGSALDLDSMAVVGVLTSLEEHFGSALKTTK
jgi:hypothetical protein